MNIAAYLESLSTDRAAWIMGVDHPFASSWGAENFHVLRNDLNVTFLTGRPHQELFEEDWAKGNADPRASSFYVDFFYGASPIANEIFVSVDGGRCILPLPPHADANGSRHVPQRYLAFARLLSGPQVDFDRYAAAAKLLATNDPWPVA